MKEHIDRISKHVDRIKEIVWNDRDMLDWDTSSMTEDEIHKMSEVWKAASAIENYNIISEYSRFKKINTYIRFVYFLIIWLVIWFVILVSADYIQVKIENKSVSEIKTNKENLEKKLLSTQEILDQTKSKNDEFSILLAQKENNIKELTKEIEEIRSNLKNENKTSNNDIESTENKYEAEKTNESVENNIDETNKKCLAKISITINLREQAWLDSKIVTFLAEWTQVEVVKEQFLDWRNWYQIVTAKNTWWIANIWIENFDNTCLKK